MFRAEMINQLIIVQHLVPADISYKLVEILLPNPKYVYKREPQNYLLQRATLNQWYSIRETNCERIIFTLLRHYD